MQYIGWFEVDSGRIRISDPCYEPDTWCAGVFPARNGKWRAYVEYADEGSWGYRVSKLIAKGSSIHDSWLDLRQLDVDVGVDSGQCGIFDDLKYVANQGGEYDDKESFYGRVCELTHQDKNKNMPYFLGGCIEFGAVSSTGYGDGSYRAYGHFDKDELVYVEVRFLDDPDRYEEEDEYENEESGC